MWHIGSVHSYEPNFKVVCGIEVCPRTYENFRSFKKHIHRIHANTLPANETNSTTDPPRSDIEDVEPGIKAGNQIPSLKCSAELFLLKTKEKRRVSQVTLDELVPDLTSLSKFD